MKKVVIIGAGEIGQAIKRPIFKNAEEVVLWDKDPVKVSPQKTLSDSMSGAEVIFFCVPSWAMRSALKSVELYLNKKAIVVSLAKGLEVSTGKTMAELLDEMFLPDQPRAVLAGPMLAEEINLGLPSFGILGSTQKDIFKRIRTLFLNTNLKIEYCADYRVVSASSVLKNIYALALGIGQGLGFGDNFKSVLVVQALSEINTIGKFLAGDDFIFETKAGLGDFLATGYSHYSKNHEMGEEIVKTGRCSQKSEGLISLAPLLNRLGDKVSGLPLLQKLEKVFIDSESAKTVFGEI